MHSHTCIHLWDTRAHTNMHVHARTLAFTRTHTLTPHTHTCTHKHALSSHTHTVSHTHTLSHTRTLSHCIHTRTHSHTLTHTHTHTRTHTLTVRTPFGPSVQDASASGAALLLCDEKRNQSQQSKQHVQDATRREDQYPLRYIELESVVHVSTAFTGI